MLQSSREKGDEFLDFGAEFLAVDDDVYHAVGEEELRPLEALGQLLPDGLLDDSRSREADEGARLGDDDVPAKGKARQNTLAGGTRDYWLAESSLLGAS